MTKDDFRSLAANWETIEHGMFDSMCNHAYPEVHELFWEVSDPLESILLSLTFQLRRARS